mmetsp:Transcript_8944/g.31732  ORF Transcript_8944/g.31732 Transcript_8944/m.31732 type:complete len:401 (-) Transcript_8944:2242-3444(-)
MHQGCERRMVETRANGEVEWNPGLCAVGRGWRKMFLVAWIQMLSASALQRATTDEVENVLHIALAPGPSHCQPSAVTIASISLSLPWNHRAHVHVFQGRDKCSQLLNRLDEKLRNIQVSFHYITKNITLKGPVCERRKELCTKENFASFLAPQMLDVDRILYLDVDTVVVGDLSKLLNFDLGQAPVAGVEDCSQKMVRYFRDKQEVIGRYPSVPETFFDACVINRGVVLINARAWKEFRMTEKVFQIFAENLEDPLWFSGVSQPPFLLALAFHPFKRLPYEYNVRGLGRKDIGLNEFTVMIRENKVQCEIDKDLFVRRVWGHAVDVTVLSPFAHPYTHCGKILHFTGARKPWKDRSDAICSCGYQCLQPCRDFYLFFEKYVAVLLGEQEIRKDYIQSKYT